LDGTNSPATYLISKLALILVAILKRTWLSSWDDPLPIMLELYNISADSRLLVLQVLRYIIEDCCLSPEEPMPAKRKKLLNQMLTVSCCSENVLRQIYPDGVEWLEALPGWTKWGVPAQRGLLVLVSTTILERTTEILGGGNVDGKVIRELLSAIKFLQVCVPWIPHRFVPFFLC
jgi:Exportin 1-like protein